MKPTIFFTILFSLFVITNANAWVMDSDFEDGPLGQLAQPLAASGSTLALGKTTFSSDNPFTGSKSGKAHLDPGDGGNKWGAWWTFTEKVYEGDEVWARAWMYFPPNFQWSSDAHQKGLRINVKNSSGGSAGYFDAYPGASSIYILNGPGLSNYWTSGAGGSAKCSGDKSCFQYAPGSYGWQSIEMYVKASTTKGIFRVWRNGELLINDTQSETLAAGSSGNYLAGVAVFTFFNSTGGSPVSQDTYMDDVFITNEPPNNFDSQGNRFIGIGDVTITAKPKPPTIN